VLIPAISAPVIACLVAACGTWLVYRITRNVMEKRREEGFRCGHQVASRLASVGWPLAKAR
jgi:PiT family inorganic phosphate transporter